MKVVAHMSRVRRPMTYGTMEKNVRNDQRLATCNSSHYHAYVDIHPL